MGREIRLGNGEGGGKREFLHINDLGIGGKISGKFVGMNPGKFGNSYDLEQADGTIKSLDNDKISMLRDKMARVAPGAEVTITYVGRYEKPGVTPDKFPYTVNVSVDKEAPESSPQAAASGEGFKF